MYVRVCAFVRVCWGKGISTFGLVLLLHVGIKFYMIFTSCFFQYIIKVLTLMKRVIPIVSAITQKVGVADSTAEAPPFTNGMHYALVETDHPYKAPGVNLFKVRALIVIM